LTIAFRWFIQAPENISGNLSIMTTILIGIDDTDNPTSRGTGWLARQLYAECKNRGLQPFSVTRHQFLLDPAIPYTSHNSGACITVAADGGIEQTEFAFDFVAQRAAPGSDPGVCLACPDDVTDEIISFAQAATTEVVTMDQAINLARNASIPLRGLGGTNLGIIGALASVGLRTEGNQGRYIDLPGLRELPDRVQERDLTALGIELEYKLNGRQHLPDDSFETLGWVRPRLCAGKPVLLVEWSKENNAWIPVDRKKSRPLE
jgi:hypothetical protein